MKDTFVVCLSLAILFFACTGPTVAQEIELIPELKPYEPLLGKWSYEGEVRESPTAEWKKDSGSYEVRSGGFFVEYRGTNEIAGEKTSWLEIVGYDPVKRTITTSFYSSDGSRGGVTSADWQGTTHPVNFTLHTSDREVQVRRVVWEFSPDFKSETGTVEQFSDGKWWAVAKYEDTKVE